MEQKVIGWKELSEIVLKETCSKSSRNDRNGWIFLIYPYNCNFCQFGGIGQWPCYLSLPNLSPRNPSQPVPWNRSRNPSRSRTQRTERNGDGMIGIRTNKEQTIKKNRNTSNTINVSLEAGKNYFIKIISIPESVIWESGSYQVNSLNKYKLRKIKNFFADCLMNK